MAGAQGPTPLIAGRYRLGSRLGHGGMAEVLDAFDERLERPVAVKVLRPEVAADAGMRRRFEAEARSAARFSHPSVVSVYDSGEHAGRAFLVMERLPGETLADRIRMGPVDQVWLRTVAFDVLAALGAAHEIGLLHRDIKPGNVLITEENRAKVADFGIAKMMVGQGGATGDETAVGLVLGTPAYLAPERLAGQPATVATDLFALGVVLYEAATGRKPPAGALDVTVAGTVAAGGSAADAVPVIEPDLARVIRRAMAPRPEDRYSSADAMAADLRRGGDVPPTVLAAPTALADPGTRVLPAALPPVVETIERADHRRALGIAAAILLVIIAVIIILILAANTKSPSNTPSTTTVGTPVPPSTAPPATVPATTTPSTAAPTTPAKTVPTTTTPTTVPTTTTTRPATTTTTAPKTTTTTAPPSSTGP